MRCWPRATGWPPPTRRPRRWSGSPTTRRRSGSSCAPTCWAAGPRPRWPRTAAAGNGWPRNWAPTRRRRRRRCTPRSCAANWPRPGRRRPAQPGPARAWAARRATASPALASPASSWSAGTRSWPTSTRPRCAAAVAPPRSSWWTVRRASGRPRCCGPGPPAAPRPGTPCCWPHAGRWTAPCRWTRCSPRWPRCCAGSGPRRPATCWAPTRRCSRRCSGARPAPPR